MPDTAPGGPLRRLLAGRPYLFISIAVGALAFLALPGSLRAATRAILAWDVGGLLLLAMYAILFSGERQDRMEADAERQRSGEWIIFWITVLGAAASFAAIVIEFTETKDAPPHARQLYLALVAATLLLSWLLTHTLFALRYAHEYYERDPGAATVQGGLDFPGGQSPDYWDFVYFSVVLGMTFQVSDVQITRRSLRRLATAHGAISFLFNTVIVALTVNLAAGLL